ncbi:MAG: hypothetical protein GX432_05955 [Candidatus Atribacteria bacterium]|nr:hypothetical protein [Candidatus Atribacteria bacterium]
MRQSAFLASGWLKSKICSNIICQSTLTVADEEKRKLETNSLNRIPDSFKKIVVVKDDIISLHDEQGLFYVRIRQFLPDEAAMDL